jgi:hypothetical protein
LISPELAAEITQQHEAFFTQLEALAVEAIASNDWSAFYAHVVDFQNEHDLHGEASTKSLTGSGADLLPQTEQRI